MSLLSELKRRHVFRVAAAYLVVAWLVLQIADILGSILELPGAVGKIVFLLLAIGFPVALVLAWAFELTPDGAKLDNAPDNSSESKPTSGRMLDFAIIGVLLVAVGLFAADKFLWTPSRQAETASTPERRTIAVLPFVNRSDDPEQAYFSDGLSEELLNLLAQVPDLRVTSRTSAFSLRDSNMTVPEVGEILGVDHILEGSVRRSGDSIRITAQLIDVTADAQVWSDTWDREFSNVFAIQDDIAESVADALKIELLGTAPHALETTRDAYELYLQARVLMEQRTASAFQQAEAINKRVLDIDSGYAPAWTQRAMILYNGAAWAAWDVAESAPEARAAAQQALQLNDQDADAHALLAMIAIDFDYDYALAGRELAVALDLNADSMIVLQAAKEFEQRQGNLEAAIQYLERMQAVDPLGARWVTAALAYFYAGRHEEGIELWRESIRNNPNSEFLQKSLALSLLETGDIDGALDAIEKEPAAGHRLQGLALIYEAIGDRTRSTEALDSLIEIGRRFTFEIAEVHSYRGELDEAFEWMERAFARRDRALRHLMYSPYLDNMRADPRFDDVLARAGLKNPN